MSIVVVAFLHNPSFLHSVKRYDEAINTYVVTLKAVNCIVNFGYRTVNKGVRSMKVRNHLECGNFDSPLKFLPQCIDARGYSTFRVLREERDYEKFRGSCPVCDILFPAIVNVADIWLGQQESVVDFN